MEYTKYETEEIESLSKRIELAQRDLKSDSARQGRKEFLRQHIPQLEAKLADLKARPRVWRDALGNELAVGDSVVVAQSNKSSHWFIQATIEKFCNVQITIKKDKKPSWGRDIVNVNPHSILRYPAA